MNHKQIVTAGWMAMISAFIALPLAYFTFKLETAQNHSSTLLLSALQVTGTMLFIVVTMNLKRFLHRNFRFPYTNRQIDLMVMANTIAGLFAVLSFEMPALKEPLSMAVIAIVLFQGIIQIQFGYRLLKLPDDLGGLLKPFCYAHMITGVCVASLVFIIVGVVVSAISDLMLGTIFFNAVKNMKAPESHQGA